MSCGICGRPVAFLSGQAMRCPHCGYRLWMKDENERWTNIMQTKGDGDGESGHLG